MMNSSTFLTYPHYVFANAVLVEGKLANFMTGSDRWSKKDIFCHTQPSIVHKNHDKISVKTRSFFVRNAEEHNKAFDVLAKKFYKKFELVDGYNLAFKPY